MKAGTKHKKSKNPRTIGEHFDRKYGKEGSEARREFERQAEAFLIAELIREKRKEANMTQEDLARKLKVNRAYISKIERAGGDIRLSTLRRIVEDGFGGKLEIDVKL